MLDVKTNEKQQTKTKSVKKIHTGFWKQFKLSKRFLIYFATAFLAYFVLVILCTISFCSTTVNNSADTFTVGRIWSFSPNSTSSSLNVTYTTYLMALFFVNILVIIFLLFSLVYFVMDQRKEHQGSVFKSVNWRLIYLTSFFFVSVLIVAFVLAELTSVAKSYQLTIYELSSPHFGGLWKLTIDSSWTKFKTVQTKTNELITAFLWIWLIIFVASFFVLGFVQTQQARKKNQTD